MIPKFFDCGRYRFPTLIHGKNTRARPLVMGILNVTPDSFSDGGQFSALDAALSRAEQMIEEGVDIIDIGGESSRPGATPLSLEEELQRVIPLVYALRDCGRAISVDTYKPQVMREAILAGADMINDIHGFATQEARTIVADSDVACCIMHMQNSPMDMQREPHYENVVDEVSLFLRERSAQLMAAGLDAERICIDPGFGFGKNYEHNCQLMRSIAALEQQIGLPILIGVSRKSMIGQLTGKTVEHRMAGSLAAALYAATQGARIVRVHDVAETLDALKVWQTLSDCDTDKNV